MQLAKEAATLSRPVVLMRPPIEVEYFCNMENLASLAINEEGRVYKGIFVAINALKLVDLWENENQHENLKNPLYYSDGFGAILLNGWVGKKIAGVELWREILERYAEKNKRIIILGSAPKTSRICGEKLRKLFPRMELTTIDGFQKEVKYCDLVKNWQPDCVFVSMGSPRQERLISKLQEVNRDCFYMGVGGSLDIFSGVKKRAPKIFLKFNLEFLYRLLKEPYRIRRQLKLFKFIWLLLARKLTSNKL